MPMIWGYSPRADDYIEMEWVDDSDWDQEAWDEWDRMEAAHDREIARRLSPRVHLTYAHYREWHNMRHGQVTIAAFNDYSRSITR